MSAFKNDFYFIRKPIFLQTGIETGSMNPKDPKALVIGQLSTSDISYIENQQLLRPKINVISVRYSFGKFITTCEK